MSQDKVSRRSLLESLVAASALGTFDFDKMIAQPLSLPEKLQPTSEFALLKTPIRSDTGVSAYKVGAEGAAPPASVPNILLRYDKEKKQFLNPLNVKADLDKGTYTLKARLHAFNHSKANDSIPNVDAQIGVNVTTQLLSGMEKFAWISKSAADIFTATGSDQQKKLATFKLANNTPAPPLTSVIVTNGMFDLQVNVFFQKKAGFWRSLLNSIANIPGSPLLATLGIPGIALSALDFIGVSLNKLANNEPLTPLWNARPITFGLTKDVDTDFKFAPGLWIAVDTAVARSTKGLEGYHVDLEYETYSIYKGDKPDDVLDANYLVADFEATKS